jgi:superfamily II DNA or RNA helicase/HKD family nuclease
VSRLRRGLYETLVTEALDADLGALAEGDASLVVDTQPLRDAEAADRIAWHVSSVLERALEALPEKKRARMGLEVARSLLDHIAELVAASEARLERPSRAGEVLRAVVGRAPDGSPERLPHPLIPLVDTALLTNAPGEPRVVHQLVEEIASADRVDIVMAFIRLSGIKPLLARLREHCERGKPLRVLTTTFTGTTEAAALTALAALGAEVRVSYDTTSTRLHAKAWLFHRASGWSTAYVGSSNLTHTAQVTGKEWNVRLSGARNRSVVDKVASVFETYWKAADFVPFAESEFLERTERPGTDTSGVLRLSPIELTPRPFQERLLEQIALARRQGHHRNLLVSATGTGKTVMAAVDYARLRGSLPRARLLFVAHRKEILVDGARPTFCQALGDANFGELWVDGLRPTQWDHVFASIQSIAASGLEHLAPDHFDVVVIDEFHHAAASSYLRLLEHVAPRELLGMTATPERADGLDILHWFDGRVAAELRLWDAIDQDRLSPFTYYGVADETDFRQVTWTRGRYRDDELERVLTADDVWARFVLRQLADKVADVRRIRCFGFCVGVGHARFMARVFNAAGVPSVAVWGDSPAEERRAALDGLRSGAINVVFSVDLFNEGVDVPVLDTLLLLRPTDSPTLFLQQLGRGLRKAADKDTCLVLDFVGQHRREFRFERKLRALLGGTRRDLERSVDEAFPFLPAGCHMELDRVSRERVLESIRNGVPARWNQRVAELRAHVRVGVAANLESFLAHSGLELEDVYSGGDGKGSWSDLCEAAGLPTATAGEHERILRKGIGRLLHVDDTERLAAYRELLDAREPWRVEELPRRRRRLLRMLVASVGDKALAKTSTQQEGADLLWRHEQVRAELAQLFRCLEARVDHLHMPLQTHADVPLQVHARYSRIELLAAFGVGKGAKVAAWQTGVRWLPKQRSDLFAFTLDKTRGQFSPTTRYRDYAISPNLIHWESQSVVREDSDTGRRYQEHEKLGTHVLLFARLNVDDRAFWFLGPARYVGHQGELPMAVTWELAHPLPGDLFARFAAAA